MTRTETAERPDFDEIVEGHYQALYRFALGLARSEAEGCELVQYTFMQLVSTDCLPCRESEINTWLSATLYRQYLFHQEGGLRWARQDLSERQFEPPIPALDAVERLEPLRLMECLQSISEGFRVPLLLFFVRDHSCGEIAEILSIPVGTAISRLSRGKRMLWNAILELPSHDQVNESRV